MFVDEMLSLGFGVFEIDQIYIGDTPVSSMEPGTVETWLVAPNEHNQNLGQIEDAVWTDVKDGPAPYPFSENTFTSPEVEKFEFIGEMDTDTSGPFAISGNVFASTGSGGTLVPAYIDNIADTVDIRIGQEITLSGTASNNVTFEVGTVVADSVNANAIKIYQTYNGPQVLTDEPGMSGTYSTVSYFDRTLLAGPFRCQKIGQTIWSIDCDIEFPYGLFYFDSTGGNVKFTTVDIDITYQQVDEITGAPVAAPIVISRQYGNATKTPQRFTVKSGVLPAGTYDCSMQRKQGSGTDPANQTTDTLIWSGLKGNIVHDETRTVYGPVSLLVLRMKATNGLGSAARSRVRVTAKRILPGVESDNPASVVKDIWTNADYGLARPLSELAPEVDELEIYWSGAEGPKFNGSYDTKGTGFDAMQTTVSMTGSNIVQDGGFLTIVPDMVKGFRTGLFSSANIVRDSLAINYTFDPYLSYDCVEVEFRDPINFNVAYARYPTTGETPDNYKLFGCTDPDYAAEFANYLWAVRGRRRKQVSFTTELEGLIPFFGDRIAVSHPLPTWGQSGVFVRQIDSLTWVVDQDLDWTTDNIIVIRDAIGMTTPPYNVTQGATPNIVVFQTEPVDNDLSDAMLREPSNYIFGIAGELIRDFLVTKITPKGDQLVEVEAQTYDEEIYTNAPCHMSNTCVHDLCKEYDCGAYDAALASTAADAIWKMDETVSNIGLADSVGSNDLAIVGSTVPQTDLDALDWCQPQLGFSFGVSADARLDNASGLVTGADYAVSIIYQPILYTDLNNAGAIQIFLRGSSYRQYIYVKSDGDLVLENVITNISQELEMPGEFADGLAHVITMRVVNNEAIYVYKDYLLIGTMPVGELLVEPLGTPAIYFCGQNQSYGQYGAFWTDGLTVEEIPVLRDAWERNQSSYIDPDPNCQPLQCDAYENALIASTATGIWAMNDLAPEQGNIVPAIRKPAGDGDLLFYTNVGETAPAMPAGSCVEGVAWGTGNGAFIQSNHPNANFGQSSFTMAACIRSMLLAGLSRMFGYATADQVRFDSANQTDLVVSLIHTNIADEVFTYPNAIPNNTNDTGHVIALAFEDGAQFTVYVDWVPIATETNITAFQFNTDQGLSMGGGVGTQTYNNYVSYWDAIITPEEVSDLRDGWVLNGGA